MEYIAINIKHPSTLLILMISIFLLSSITSGQIVGDCQLLLIIAKEYEANKKALQTWSGKALINCKNTPISSLGWGTRSTESDAIFIVDWNIPAVRWKWNYHGGQEIQNTKLTKLQPRSSAGMVKSNKGYRLEIPTSHKVKSKCDSNCCCLSNTSCGSLHKNTSTPPLYNFLQDKDDVLIFHEDKSTKATTVTITTYSFPSDFNSIHSEANPELLHLGFTIKGQSEIKGSRSADFIHSGAIKNGTTQVRIVENQKVSFHKTIRRLAWNDHEGWTTVTVISNRPKSRVKRFIEHIKF